MHYRGLRDVETYRSGRNEPHSKCGYAFTGVREFESLRFRHKKSIGLIQFVSDLFSLQIGTFILSATKFRSLVEVSNGISMRLFFFLDIATERKPS